MTISDTNCPECRRNIKRGKEERYWGMFFHKRCLPKRMSRLRRYIFQEYEERADGSI